jgi:acetyltransferase-like isoleucine patch superfamily enzyme
LLRVQGAVVPRSSNVHGGTWFSSPRNLIIGERCFLNRNCYLDLEGEIIIGDDVTVGHGTSIVTTVHEIGPPEHRCGPAIRTAPVVLENGCWIGANVTLLPGVTVGAGAVVAAGAVVSADIPPNTVAAGVPARVVRKLEDEP